MVLTPERQKLKQDAIRISQELGWSNHKIAAHLDIPRRTIDSWVGNNPKAKAGNNSPLTFNTVHSLDCLDGMAKMPHESIELVFADPPYNIGVNYNGNGFTDKNGAYIEWCCFWFKAAYRVLQPGGSFYAMHYPQICALWLPKLEALGFTFQKWITWHFPTNIGQSPNNWTTSQRTILFVTKGNDPAYFNGLADPQPYRNPTDKRIRELIETGNPGVTPYDVWDYNLVKNVSDDKTSWPNQIPVQLVERIIKVSCPPDGKVLDPFMGSGTTAIAAIKTEHEWIGFDLSPESATETEARIGKL
jgi:site-specific DNA-methyltransferase (adenine-specific)